MESFKNIQRYKSMIYLQMIYWEKVFLGPTNFCFQVMWAFIQNATLEVKAEFTNESCKDTNEITVSWKIVLLASVFFFLLLHSV